MNKQKFTSFRSVLVPIFHGRDDHAVLQVARELDAQITLVGLVPVSPDESLSLSAAAARQMRQQLRKISEDALIHTRARVVVSYQVWNDLLKIIQDDEPDLLLLDWDMDFAALGITSQDVLARPPCNVGVLRGPFPKEPLQILAPMRGGPHAELTLRTALSFRDAKITTLHLNTPEERHLRTDAPFRGLQRVLSQLPEVEKQVLVTSNPSQAILEKSQDFNLLIMGTTAQALNSPISLGPVADSVMKNSNMCILAVKSRRPMPQVMQPDETMGAQAISILVDKWFAENTFHADEFADLKRLVALKESSGLRISLALPALNEEETVANVINTVKKSLMENVPLLDEIVLVDSNSSDRTREIARDLGIPVYIHQELLPELGPRSGKGEALWKSLFVTSGDIVAWIDTDIVNIHPRFVYGIIGPLLINPRVQLVKGFYRRPLKTGNKLEEGGGRVTELTARPMINLFYPELSGVVQPLSGEYAARRSFLEKTPFFSTYGVETGLLIDAFDTHGLASIAQVDLLERIHHNQTLEALSKMSFVILQAFLHKLEKRYGQQMVEDVNKSMKLVRHTPGGYFLEVEEIIEHERPAMIEVPAYQARCEKTA